MEDGNREKTNNSMEESVLLPKSSVREEEAEVFSSSSGSSGRWDGLSGEVKKLGCIAAPMVAVTSSQKFVQIISVMMVGHLGELALASTGMAMSFTGVTGFSILSGMACALETLCGQAYGAHQYRRVGTQTYTAIFCLFLVCLPLSLLWIYLGKILVFIGQDPQISYEAGKFTMWLVPGLLAYAILQPLNRYFQTQSLIIPMFLCSCFTLILHIPLCWALVFKSGLGNLGGALAISISNWLNVIFLVVYMKLSPACAKTRVTISMELRELESFSSLLYLLQ